MSPLLAVMVVLDLEKLAKDTELVPYWNECCLAIQSELPLPIGGPSQSTRWRETYLTENPTSPTFTVPASREPRVETACKKIRIYPTDPEKVDNQIHACRRAYNLCVAKYREWTKGDKPVDRNKLRSQVREATWAG